MKRVLRRAVPVLAAAALVAAVVTALQAPLVGRQADARTPVAILPTGDMLDRYARGQLPAIALGVDTTMPFGRQLRRVAPQWIGARTAPDVARRRLAVASFVLDLDAANLDNAWQPVFGNDLIEWACGLLREGPPSAAERDWYVASIALLERAHQTRFSQPAMGVGSAARRRREATDDALRFHVAHADARFPGDPQWALNRAIAEELVTWPMARDEEKLVVAWNVEARIRSRYREAIALPAVRDEAHLRLGYFELRRAQVVAALDQFDRASPSTSDPATRYWLHLLRGRALTRAGRTADAVAAYRRAVAEFSGAQSATVALGALLSAERESGEGRDLVTRMLTQPPAMDPWRLYEFPTSRHWAAAMTTVYGAIRP